MESARFQPNATRRLEFSEEIKIPVPWGHLAAKVWGPPDGTPVLALHGLLDNAGSFDMLAPLLPPNICLICYDLSGHGHSSHYPKGIITYYYDHVYHIKLVIDHFKWEKVILIGHSIGSIAAITFTCLFPEMVSKLISLDIVKPLSLKVEKLPIRMKEIVLKFQGIAETERMLLTYDEAREQLLNTYKGSIDAKAAEILLLRSSKKTAGNKYEFTQDLRNIVPTLTLSEDQVKQLLSNLHCPFLIIKAKSGMQSVGAEEKRSEYYDLYRQVSPDFRLVEVEGTHHVHLTHPERVAPYICNFIVPRSRL